MSGAVDAVGRSASSIRRHLGRRYGLVEVTLPLVEEPESCADDLAGTAISAGGDLTVDESLKLGSE
jgi:hypothetical protein